MTYRPFGPPYTTTELLSEIDDIKDPLLRARVLDIAFQSYGRGYMAAVDSLPEPITAIPVRWMPINELDIREGDHIRAEWASDPRFGIKRGDILAGIIGKQQHPLPGHEPKLYLGGWHLDRYKNFEVDTHHV